MASIYDLKPRFQALLRPAVDRLAGAGVTANQVTVAAILVSLAHGGCITLMAGDANPSEGPLFWALVLLPVTLLVRMALNAIDGMLAREHGQQSARGAVLNEVGDMVSDAALYLPMALLAGSSAPLVVAIVAVAIISEAVGIQAQAMGGSRAYHGPFGKSDRAVFFGLTAVLITVGLMDWPHLAALLLVAGLVAGVITVFNRARAAVAGAQEGSLR